MGGIKEKKGERLERLVQEHKRNNTFSALQLKKLILRFILVFAKIACDM